MVQEQFKMLNIIMILKEEIENFSFSLNPSSSLLACSNEPKGD